MRALRLAIQLLRDYGGPYLALNAAFYGIVLCGMLIGAANPGLHEQMVEGVRLSVQSGILHVVYEAYKERQIVRAAALTFGVNLTLGSFGTITLPSMVIPFVGLLMGCLRALIWGILFSPVSPHARQVFIPHLPVLLVEGQAYVLTMLAVYIQGTAFLRPHTVGAQSMGRGYYTGLCRSGQLYLLIIVVLAISAVYESIEGFFFFRP